MEKKPVAPWEWCLIFPCSRSVNGVDEVLGGMRRLKRFSKVIGSENSEVLSDIEHLT